MKKYYDAYANLVPRQSEVSPGTKMFSHRTSRQKMNIMQTSHIRMPSSAANQVI